jgi:hypothetical protein
MRKIVAPLAVLLTLGLTACSSGVLEWAAAPTPETSDAMPTPEATPTPDVTPTTAPEPGPVAAIDVSATGLTLVDEAGVLVDEVDVADGSELVSEVLTTALGRSTEKTTTEDTCIAAGTVIRHWPEAGATMVISPKADGLEDAFHLVFKDADDTAPIEARVPEGPAVNSDAGAYFDSLLAEQVQRGSDPYGVMIYDVASDAADGPLGAGGYVDDSGILQSLSVPASFASFSC